MSPALRLLATDLDRTLIPNGPEEESDQARPVFRAFCKAKQVTLVYVSGRNLNLILEAINEYDLPLPQYAIADVGTSIYRRDGKQWVLIEAWHDHLRQTGWSVSHIKETVESLKLPDISLQEEEHQNLFKISYYLKGETNRPAVEEALKRKGITCQMIWSEDTVRHLGLLDILPSVADKFEALSFLLNQLSIHKEECLFSGDSGNDLGVLTSGIPSVLVKNAEDSVRQTARQFTTGGGAQKWYYEAKGNWHGLNGNYSSGILEGIDHFFPKKDLISYFETGGLDS